MSQTVFSTSSLVCLRKTWSWTIVPFTIDTVGHFYNPQSRKNNSNKREYWKKTMILNHKQVKQIHMWVSATERKWNCGSILQEEGRNKWRYVYQYRCVYQCTFNRKCVQGILIEYSNTKQYIRLLFVDLGLV